MFKYLRWILKIYLPLQWNYFRWMRAYSRHPERYPFEQRFLKCKKLAIMSLRILKVDIEVINKPDLDPNETYYFVANHISMLDPVVSIAILDVPCTYISKAEVAKIPFIGIVISILQGVFIERGNLKQEIKALQTTRKSLANKESSWVVFPEGTRNLDYNAPLNEYKSGTFKAPLQTDTTVVPFVMWGTQVVMNPRTRARRFKVVVEFLPAINLNHLETNNTHEIAEQIQYDSEIVMNRLRDEYGTKVKLNKYGRKLVASK